MRIHILAIGRLRNGPVRDLVDDYLRRLDWPVTIREFDSKKSGNAKLVQQDENTLLADAIPDNARLIVLDERGRDLSSRQFAGKIEAWQHDGVGDIACIIGGADGLLPELRKRADLCICFGKQTWPHMMVRAMLVEQLYRARQILAGHPYHRG